MPIDWKFISAKEGGCKLTGYIPQKKNGDVIGISGVTIGTGFDIGQFSEGEIKSMHLGDDLTNKLLPYTSVPHGEQRKGKAAQKLLSERTAAGNPLVIDQKDAVRLDQAVKQKMVAAVRRSYDRGAKLKKKTLLFDGLPDDIQTAIASFMFQHGPGIYDAKFKGKPQYIFYGLVTDQLWEEAAVHLPKCSGPLDRRQGEAKLIRQGAKRLTAETKPDSLSPFSPFSQSDRCQAPRSDGGFSRQFGGATNRPTPWDGFSGK